MSSRVFRQRRAAHAPMNVPTNVPTLRTNMGTDMRIDAGIEQGAQSVEQLSTDDAGATALEYGFFVAFVAAALLIGAEILAGGVGGMYTLVNGVVEDKVGSATK
jgi:Flp pilus assembly pilin Flp